MHTYERAETQTRFLNVDVDVLSKVSLEPLLAALGSKILPLYVGREGRYYSAHFELAASSDEDVDKVTRRLAGLIAGLRGAARKLWKEARTRGFNVGIQGGINPRMQEIAIEEDTVNLVARVGGRIVVTTYAAEIATAPRGRAQSARDAPPNDSPGRKRAARAGNRRIPR
ncbi:MAG: hypothetical protein AB1714_21780 [Acidobacteriota bacterium]